MWPSRLRLRDPLQPPAQLRLPLPAWRSGLRAAAARTFARAGPGPSRWPRSGQPARPVPGRRRPELPLRPTPRRRSRGRRRPRTTAPAATSAHPPEQAAGRPGPCPAPDRADDLDQRDRRTPAGPGGTPPPTAALMASAEPTRSSTRSSSPWARAMATSTPPSTTAVWSVELFGQHTQLPGRPQQRHGRQSQADDRHGGDDGDPDGHARSPPTRVRSSQFRSRLVRPIKPVPIKAVRQRRRAYGADPAGREATRRPDPVPPRGRRVVVDPAFQVVGPVLLVDPAPVVVVGVLVAAPVAEPGRAR